MNSNLQNSNTNNDIGFLDFVTLASYLMAADNLETNDKFRDKVFAQLNRIEQKLNTILNKINKE